MAIDNPDEIDFVSQSRETGRVTMVVSDHLPWDDIPGHLALLQQKIAKYRQFIESGHLDRLAPAAIKPPKGIEIYFMVNPPRGPAIDFLEATGDELAQVGIAFSYRQFTGYR